MVWGHPFQIRQSAVHNPPPPSCSLVAPPPPPPPPFFVFKFIFNPQTYTTDWKGVLSDCSKHSFSPPPPPHPHPLCVCVCGLFFVVVVLYRTTYYKGEFGDCFGHSFNSISEFAMKESTELKCVGTGPGAGGYPENRKGVE